MSKYNEQYATTMLNALQGTETLERFKQEIRAEAIDEIKLLVIKNHCDELHCHCCDDKPISPKNTMCALRELEEHFDKAIEQLKGQK